MEVLFGIEGSHDKMDRIKILKNLSEISITGNILKFILEFMSQGYTTWQDSHKQQQKHDMGQWKNQTVQREIRSLPNKIADMLFG